MGGEMVRLHVTDDLPIRAYPVAFEDRVEIRFGKAFPAVLVVERDSVNRLRSALKQGGVALGVEGDEWE
ncbi:hypothetical protein LZG04_01865 [Saccharothrix sp. S26]|uniref:hypothetical protein n=1 Tax=Saccharothrix sp. S26 TaxID=2907215 RepID=UPI001F167882|nr:hypothetical protein [Saccharothrix sp. S26]MCE6993560.1 hypothetical protein [Saccharothrix sp. S26]